MADRLAVSGRTVDRRDYSAAIPGPAPASAAFSSATFRTARSAWTTRPSNPGFEGSSPRNVSSGIPNASAARRISVRRFRKAMHAVEAAEILALAIQRTSSSVSSRASPASSVSGGLADDCHTSSLNEELAFLNEMMRLLPFRKVKTQTCSLPSSGALTVQRASP